jgi:hypothetical protein
MHVPLLPIAVVMRESCIDLFGTIFFKVSSVIIYFYFNYRAFYLQTGFKKQLNRILRNILSFLRCILLNRNSFMQTYSTLLFLKGTVSATQHEMEKVDQQQSVTWLFDVNPNYSSIQDFSRNKELPAYL